MAQGDLTIYNFRRKVQKSAYIKFNNQHQDLYPDEDEFAEIIGKLIDVFIEYYFKID
jgi:hypothetical protein